MGEDAKWEFAMRLLRCHVSCSGRGGLEVYRVPVTGCLRHFSHIMSFAGNRTDDTPPVLVRV
jgi:hypothetical protein